MLANDARILIRSAVATAVAGAILVVIGAIANGGKGALGAFLGVVLVAVFFSISVVAVSLAGRLWGPAAMTAAALGTFLLKVLGVLALVAAFQDTTVFNTKLFGLTAIACILVWSGGQIAAARRRVLYVEPESSSTPRRTGVASRPSGPGPGEQ